MDQKPLLTIAVPTYNGGKTICYMLELLLPQCNDCRVEVLISDNCSTDNTENIITEYKKKWPTIVYHRNSVNIGPDANFLQCMKMAKGAFTWLVSDDDVVVEGAVGKILNFLTDHKDVGLVYLTTRDFRGRYICVEKCTEHKPEVEEDLCTKNKTVFMRYAGAYWGFMSSYICNTERFNSVLSPEKYYGTYWLQSYIHALCAAGKETLLGVVKGPCVAAGIYVNSANFDSSLVNGTYYKKLIDFMIAEADFDSKQLRKWYKKRLLHLLRHDVMKEKSSGIKKIDKKRMFFETRSYPQAWFTLYPLLLLPNFICKKAMRLYRNRLNLQNEICINRPE